MRERFNALREPSQVFRRVGERLVGVDELLEFRPMGSCILRFPVPNGDECETFKKVVAHVRPRSSMASSTSAGVRGLTL